MNIKLRKVLKNTLIRNVFPNCVYLFDVAENQTFKTVDFENRIWESTEVNGNFIQNGEYSIIERDEEQTIFINDESGTIIGSESFTSFDVQLNSSYEKDYIWGYQNLVYKDGNFFADTGYFYAPEDEFVVVKKQFENERLLWVSEDSVLFLKKEGITLCDYQLENMWNLNFEEHKIEELIQVLEYNNLFILIIDNNKIFFVEKTTGKINHIFSGSLIGDFRSNYSITGNGIIKFLGAYDYIEYSIIKQEIIKKINFQNENLFIRNSSIDFHDENHIFFSGVMNNEFPNTIGIFDTVHLSFIWKFTLETENKGNSFYQAPLRVRGNVITVDMENNFYVFNSEEL